MKFSLRVFANASLRTAISVIRIIIRSQSLCTLFGVLHRPPYTYRHVGEHGARGTGLRDGGRRTQDTVIVAPPAPRSTSSALMQDRVRYLFSPLSSRQQGCTAISIHSLTACPNITIRKYLVNVYAIDQARFFLIFLFFFFSLRLRVGTLLFEIQAVVHTFLQGSSCSRDPQQPNGGHQLTT